MDELTQLGLKYKTDKAYWHRYTEFYYKYFKNIKDMQLNIIEIGINTGASILMLNEFFKNSNIYGLDIIDYQKLPISDEYRRIVDNSDRIKIIKIDQSNSLELINFFEKLNKIDIIIDDGSHMVNHQFITLGTTFKYLINNGLYICEDIHTSFSKKFHNDIFEKSMFYALKNKNFNNNFLSEYERKYLNQNIENVYMYNRELIPFVCHGCGSNITSDKKVCECNIDFTPNQEDSCTAIIIKK